MPRAESRESPRSTPDPEAELGAEADVEIVDDDDVPSMGDIAAAAITRVEHEARKHPLRTVGIAIGVGAVLGGGLPRFATRMGVVLGARVLFDAFLRRGLAELATLGDDEGTLSRDAGPRRRANGQFKGTRTRARQPD